MLKTKYQTFFIETIKDKLKVLEDRKTGSKSKYIISNKFKKEINIFQIDHKVNIPNLVLCDWGFSVLSDKKFYFIELKGSNVSHALTQILSSLNHFKSAFKKNDTINARIVCSRSPNPKTYKAKELKLKRRLMEYNKGNLIIKSGNQMHEEI